MAKLLPYLLAKARTGDMEARACMKSMADDGDDEAREALDGLPNDDDNDGNGASPEDPMDKAQQGLLFNLDALDRELGTLERFAKSDDAPEIPSAADLLGGRPEVQAAAALDAGDFVKAMVDGNVQALDRLGDGVLWGASATEALAKAQIAQGEILHGMHAEFAGLRNTINDLVKALNTRGAGPAGAQTQAQLAALRAQPRVPREGNGGGGSPPARQATKPGEIDELRKALRTKRAGETNDDMIRKIGSALEDLTVGQTDAAKALVGSK